MTTELTRDEIERLANTTKHTFSEYKCLAITQLLRQLDAVDESKKQLEEQLEQENSAWEKCYDQERDRANAANALLTGPLSHAAIIAQKDREIIAEIARADVAAERMRERCAYRLIGPDLGRINGDGDAPYIDEELAFRALIALPLHEEPKE